MPGGVTIAVEIASTRVRQMLGKILERTGNLRPVNREIGEYMVASSARNFDRQSSPDGKRWAPINDRYRRRKMAQGFSAKIGQRSGDLKNKLLHQEDDKAVMWGTNVKSASGYPYPIVFQKGNRSGTQPARPFLGVSKKDWTAIGGILVNYLEAV